ncbi:MAG: hypothetical protein ACLUVD_07105 [Mediterraneibacter faecis]
MLFKIYLPSEKELPLLDEDHILGFDEIEVSQKDAKCQLSRKMG